MHCSPPVSVARLTHLDINLLEGANDAIPTGWLLVSDEYSRLALVKLTTQGLEATGAKVMYSIAVHDDLTYSIHMREKPMSLNNTTPLKDLPKTVSTTSALSEVIKALDSTKLCIGNQHHKYHTLRGWKKGSFFNQTGKLLIVELHVHTGNM